MNRTPVIDGSRKHHSERDLPGSTGVARVEDAPVKQPWYAPTRKWSCVWFLSLCFVCLAVIAATIVTEEQSAASIIPRVVAVFILGLAIGFRRKDEHCRLDN